MITLNEAKNYLRVDHEEDDKLILQLLDTAKSLVKTWAEWMRKNSLVLKM